MDRVIFLEGLARLALLTEFALKLSQAKNLLREIKANPSISPFLVNGKIRRTFPGVGSRYVSLPMDVPSETGELMSFRDMMASPRFTRSTDSIPNSPKRKSFLTPGIGIQKKSAPGRPSNYPVLSVLAHEYGHALQPRVRDVINKNNGRIVDAQASLLHKALIQEAKGPRSFANVIEKTNYIKRRASLARNRASIAATLTAERDATLRGSEVLSRAGAGPKEIGEYFADIADSKGKVPTDDFMHHSYQGMYKSEKSVDPKVRRGGRRLTSPLFPGSMSSFQPKFS